MGICIFFVSLIEAFWQKGRKEMREINRNYIFSMTLLNAVLFIDVHHKFLSLLFPGGQYSWNSASHLLKWQKLLRMPG